MTRLAAIELEGVGKRYGKLDQQAILLRSILPFARPKKSYIWALNDLSFRVEQGETVGIIGRNGAGKTTLLRLLAGVSQPSVGRIRVRGRVAPLITLGLGFHPEMSGRENVFVNGALLGLTSAQVAKRFSEIVEFAELPDFIDTPVKFYSSGMFMRLAFAVLIHADPQVLLVDEVLAVGDLAFQRKSFDRMRQLRDAGTSIVMVSHSMYSIRQIATRAIVFKQGGVEHDGDVESAISSYYGLLSDTDRVESEGSPIHVVEMMLSNASGESHHAAYDEEMSITARVKVSDRLEDPRILFGVYTEAGMQVSLTGTRSGDEWRSFNAGDELEVRIPFRARLGGGSYRLRIGVTRREGGELLAAAETSIFVTPRAGVIGTVDLCAAIEIDGTDLTAGADLLSEW